MNAQRIITLQFLSATEHFSVFQFIVLVRSQHSTSTFQQQQVTVFREKALINPLSSTTQTPLATSCLT